MANSTPEPADDPRVEVRRSGRRRSTVTAYREGGRTVVLIPARFTRSQEEEWVKRMLDRLSAQERRRRPGDEELMTRALTLNERHLRGLATPASVTWVQNQNTRWGSCTPADRSIRLSTRLLGMPSWVLDYVLLHELAHLIQPGHGPDFWSLLDTYPRTERARGFLEGFSAARDLPMDDDPPGSAEDGDNPADHAAHADQDDEDDANPDDANPDEPRDTESIAALDVGAAVVTRSLGRRQARQNSA
nr:M48 family metallopeptidase [Kineosporia corallincola]